MITLIAAVGNDRIIGNKGKLSWTCPPDTAFFKQATLNKAVIMGRKTFESLGDSLVNRLNIVLTRNNGYRDDSNVLYASSIHQAISMGALFSEEIFIIGGEEIYTQTLPLADKLLITEIDYTGIGDVRFPVISPNRWHRHVLYNGNCLQDNLEYTIVEYSRIKSFDSKIAANDDAVTKGYVSELLTANMGKFENVY
jgi:dihydrofolate reductase